MFVLVEPSVVLEEVGEALARLDDDGVRGLSDAEVAECVVEAHRVQAVLQATLTRLVGELDARGVWAEDGARGAAPWLMWKCRVPAGEARREVADARALQEMPATASAFAAGEVGSAQVRVLAGAQRCSPEGFADAEGYLLDAARQLRVDDLRRTVEYWKQAADPNGVEVDADAQHARREARCVETFDGMRDLRALLDPVAGGIVAGELERLAHHLFDADWAEARARRGDDAIVADLARTPDQRRADALVEMARRSASLPEGASRARPLLTVHVGYETFAGRICHLADGAVLSPGQVVPLLAEADVERVVFAGPSRVLDVGRRQRLFTGATRRAVEVRDLRCAHPTCDVPYARCEVDHVVPYEHGGDTTQANGQLLCRFHHRQRHRACGGGGPPRDRRGPAP